MNDRWYPPETRAVAFVLVLVGLLVLGIAAGLALGWGLW